MARYPRVGGPCDGTQSFEYTVKPPTGYQELCQTHLYTFGADGRFHDAGLAPILVGAGGIAQVNTLQIDRAWHRFMHALGVDGPRAIRKSAADRKRLRRAVR